MAGARLTAIIFVLSAHLLMANEPHACGPWLEKIAAEVVQAEKDAAKMRRYHHFLVYRQPKANAKWGGLDTPEARDAFERHEASNGRR
jgi:hypothetical protein